MKVSYLANLLPLSISSVLFSYPLFLKPIHTLRLISSCCRCQHFSNILGCFHLAYFLLSTLWIGAYSTYQAADYLDKVINDALGNISSTHVGFTNYAADFTNITPLRQGQVNPSLDTLNVADFSGLWIASTPVWYYIQLYHDISYSGSIVMVGYDFNKYHGLGRRKRCLDNGIVHRSSHQALLQRFAGGPCFLQQPHFVCDSLVEAHFLISGTPPHPGPLGLNNVENIWCAVCLVEDGLHTVHCHKKRTASEVTQLTPHFVHQVPSSLVLQQYTFDGKCLWVTSSAAPQGGWYLTQPLQQQGPPPYMKDALSQVGAYTQICDKAYKSWTTLKLHTVSAKRAKLVPTNTLKPRTDVLPTAPAALSSNTTGSDAALLEPRTDVLPTAPAAQTGNSTSSDAALLEPRTDVLTTAPAALTGNTTGSYAALLEPWTDVPTVPAALTGNTTGSDAALLEPRTDVLPTAPAALTGNTTSSYPVHPIHTLEPGNDASNPRYNANYGAGAGNPNLSRSAHFGELPTARTAPPVTMDMQLLEEIRKLTSENRTLQANVVELQSDKRCLEGRVKVLTAGKQQRTVDGMLSSCKAKVANSYAGPREVINTLGIKSTDGLSLPRS